MSNTTLTASKTPKQEMPKTSPELARPKMDPKRLQVALEGLRRCVGKPMPTHRVIDVTTPVPVADDTYHALRKGIPPIGSFLLSLPEYIGSDTVDCRFNLPHIGTIVVPGLGSSIFRTQAVPSYTASLRSSGLDIIRLPNIYVLLNQCMTAMWNEEMEETQLKNFGVSADRRPYDWVRAGASIRKEAAGLAARILDTHALRVRQGAGFMALAQANPNLTRKEVGIGLELAKKILADMQAAEREERAEEIKLAKQQGKVVAMHYTVISDIAGMPLIVVARFPATTSESVQTDMHTVLSGRGNCCYLNPDLLKTGMEGDVDGDLLFSEIDTKSGRLKSYRVVVPLPNVVIKENFISDFALGDCFGVEEDKPLFVYNDYKVYEGMDGKNGIGEATNLFYRGVNILHICFSQSKETRDGFWAYVGRPDLEARMPAGDNEEEQQRGFRHLSALALMDSIHPIYEGIFDLRKDDTIREYLLHFLAAVRGQEPMNFGYLSQMHVKGKQVDLRPLELMWNSAQVGERSGQPASFLNQFPIINSFFQGRGSNDRKKGHIGTLIGKLDGLEIEDPAKYIFDEMDGLHFTFLPLTEEEPMEADSF